MPGSAASRLWFALLALAVYFLYFHGLATTGLIGPDEPRYAAIGVEMARSGDWVTPRLWGSPWFEKPALLYWMTAAATRLGMGPELAPRLPVALISVAFLAGYFILLRQFGVRVAALATAILGTSAAWLVYSFAAVTDIPLTTTLTIAMLLAYEGITQKSRARLAWAGFFFGLAMLAKGLAPVIYAAPLIWFARRKPLALVLPIAVALATAAPWYVLCYSRNGEPFLIDFFWKHHFGRFTTPELQHVQPAWYFLRVLPATIFPWTPFLIPLARTRFADQRRRFLLAWVLFGLIFFSLSTNKLPGYMLPLLPPLCALLAIALEETRSAEWWLAACAVLLCLAPPMIEVLPRALPRGLSTVSWRTANWAYAPLAAPLAFLVWYWCRAGARLKAVGAIVLAASVAIAALKVTAFPVVDQEVSARGLWRQIGARAADVCVDDPHRALRYGLNYYAGRPLPDCDTDTAPVVIQR